VVEFRLLSIWHIKAPLEDVYAAIRDLLHWPDWWPGVREVALLKPGDGNGINSVWHASWQGQLPYRIQFDVRATRIEELVAIEGTAHGDLEGGGEWRFSRWGPVSVVRCEWHVRSNRWWMNLLAPLARSMFIRNHGRIMAQGGAALARRLKSPLMGQENIDLLADGGEPEAGRGWWRESRRIEPAAVLAAGLGAGVIATAAQLAMWWLAGMPLLETLFRDARLTAALLLGTGILSPASTAPADILRWSIPSWNILALATLIHFALSVAYAWGAARLVARLRTGPALVVGALYGLAIYGVNLYGLTLLFPWFGVARGGLTLATHLVFGVALAEGCRLSARDS
jgi:hypothetical protein